MFYDKLVELCNEKGITLTELTRRIGVNKSNVTYWKRGSEPKSSTLQKIATALDVSVIELMTGELQAKYDDLEDLSDTVKQDMIDNAESPEEYEAAIKTKRSDIQTKMLLDNIQKEKRHKLNSAFYQLNEKGQQVAIERIEELTKIPDYQKDKNA